jgi:uncharacterized protein (TIGR03437 family)
VWSQQGDRLSGTGAVGISFQGSSVALSADGNTAVLGGPGDNNYVGATWIFVRSGGVWSQQGGKLIGTGVIVQGPPRQGTSVAISADGNSVVVGASDDNNFVGAAWVFTRSGGVWSQQGDKLVGTGAIGQSRQSSVAISADASTIILGGYGDNVSLGAAWVFTRSGGVWSQQGGKLIGTGYVGQPTQGSSVALSADGNTAIVGGGYDNGGTGAAWVFTRSDGAWSQQGSKLFGTGVTSPAQGTSVALSADGNTAIVGGPGTPGYKGAGVGTGAAWVYTRSGGVWSHLGNNLFITGIIGKPPAIFSVAMSGDGNTAMVGGPFDDGYNGAAWVFVKVVAAIPSIITDGTGVINGGSYRPGDVVSGSWVAIKGDGFTDQTMDWSNLDFSTGFLPTTLNGVQVLFNGKPGAIWYLIAGTPQQINVQAPAYLAGSTSVQVLRNGVPSNIVTAKVVQNAPAMFPYTLDNGKTFYPAAVFLDGTRLGDPAMFPGARKATAGDHVSLYANSLAPSPAGVVSVYAVTNPVTVTIGPATFPADFAGAVAPGEFLINITVPRLPENANYPITLQIDGQTSPAGILFPYTN